MNRLLCYPQWETLTLKEPFPQNIEAKNKCFVITVFFSLSVICFYLIICTAFHLNLFCRRVLDCHISLMDEMKLFRLCTAIIYCLFLDKVWSDFVLKWQLIKTDSISKKIIFPKLAENIMFVINLMELNLQLLNQSNISF